jgi:hypothetical protein
VKQCYVGELAQPSRGGLSHIYIGVQRVQYKTNTNTVWIHIYSYNTMSNMLKHGTHTLLVETKINKKKHD